MKSRSIPFAVLCAFTATARSQDAPVATATQAVVITARYDDSLGLWDSASQGAITREGIEKRPLLRTGEVLESIPGLIVTQHSGEGKANQYFLRGYNLDHGTDFATWVAGMPVNMPTHAHGQGYTDLNFLIPELIARTIYKKGPYYAEEGDFASAGSAHIDYVDRLPASLASVTAGSFNYRRSLLAGSPALGGATLLYGLEYVQNDGGWDHPDNYAKLNGVLRYSQATAEGRFSVTAMAYSADWNATDQIPRRAVDTGLLSRYGTLDPTDGGLASRYSLSAEWRHAAGSVSRAASLYAVRSRLDLFSNFTFFLTDPINGDQFNQSERRTLAGGTVSQTWHAAAAGHETSTTAGIQLRHDRISPLALYTTRARQRLAVVREDEARVTSVAPYISNTFAWTDWFRSIAGLRADRVRFALTSDNPVNSGESRDSIVSPKLSLVFGPWRHTEYFLNWGKGFHSNDARGTTITVDAASGAPAARVPPLVRTKGYETGARSRPLPGFSTTLAFWTLAQDSELLFVGDAGTTEPSRPARRNGLEWLGQYAPNGHLAVDTSIALTRARFTDANAAGPLIPGAPNHVASAGVTVDGPGGWFGSLRWRYFGPRPLVEDNGVRSQSTSLVNARIGYAFDKRTRLSLDAYNLLDRKNSDIDYFYESRLAGESAPVADVHFHPVERRALRLTLTANF
jgi:outer membrane receptor protein involved in Fe transport